MGIILLVDSTGPWQTDLFPAFLSHTAEHKKEISQLKEELRARGVEAFIAHSDITPSQDWIRTIIEALQTCDAVIAWLTPDFHESVWTDQELGYCLARDVLVIPVERGLMPYGFLGQYQAILGHEPKSTGVLTTAQELSRVAFAIVRVLARQPRTAARMAEAIVAGFEESGSYMDTRDLIDVAELIPSWAADHLDRMESAIEENDQVGDYVRVDRLQDLIGRHRELEESPE